MTNERMQWSEAEAVVRAYIAERDRSARPRFVDQSGQLSAMLAAVVAVVVGGVYFLTGAIRPTVSMPVAVTTYGPVRAAVAPVTPLAPQSAVVEQRTFIGPDHKPIRIHIFKQFSEPL